MKTFDNPSRAAAIMKPTMGDNSSDLPTFMAWAQSTPLVAVCACISWLAMPTPMTEPISVCELEEGKPNHQVPRFQIMAAVSSAKTMANPAPLPTCKMSSTGSREMMPNATAPVESTTPMKFHMPDQATAICGSIECV